MMKITFENEITCKFCTRILKYARTHFTPTDYLQIEVENEEIGKIIDRTAYEFEQELEELRNDFGIND